MASLPSTTELRKMSDKELFQEIRSQQSVVRKMRIEIGLNKEKDSAKYRRERRQLARMETVLTEKKHGEPLKEAKKSSTVSPHLRASRSGGQARSASKGKSESVS